MYFFVPKGMKRIAIQTRSRTGLKVRDGDGKPVALERGGSGQSLLVLDVPDGQDNKVWSIANFRGSTPLRMLNLPTVLAPAADMVMTPSSLSYDSANN
jgi:hypothetical protein